MRARPIVLPAAIAAVFAGALFVLARPPLDGIDLRDIAATSAVARDTSFGARILRLSEDGGYFDTDNLISNERSYLHVAPTLRQRGGGGAYIGVGPDQNFAYIALLRPAVAYIVDIRRDNLLAHLFFKAMFERSRNRLEYFAGLTGRVAPGALEAWDSASLTDILAWVEAAPATEDELVRVHADVRARLGRYGYPLDEADHAWLERMHRTFVEEGLALRFTTHGRAPMPYYPSWRDLLLETDRAGTPSGAFTDEASFRFVKRMHQEDRIVPVVGDFAGTHALRAIAEELRSHRLNVRAFYTSNVEYYLFRDGGFDAFAANIAALPWHDDGVIVRSVFRTVSPRTAHHWVPGYGSAQLAQRVATFLGGVRAARYNRYTALIDDEPLPPR